MKGPRDHALGLLTKAEHDLVAARATLATGKATDMVCFHAQRAVEKSLKALLNARLHREDHRSSYSCVILAYDRNVEISRWRAEEANGESGDEYARGVRVAERAGAVAGGSSGHPPRRVFNLTSARFAV